MNAIQYAVSLFTDYQWAWSREDVKDILLAANATFEEEDADHEIDHFVGVHGGRISFIYGQTEQRAPVVEILLRQDDIDDTEEGERDDIIEAYDAEYEKTVEAVRGLLGDYAYEGTSAGSPLTDDQYGDLCACWVRNDVRLMVQEVQLDTELPIQLGIFIAPKKL